MPDSHTGPEISVVGPVIRFTFGTLTVERRFNSPEVARDYAATLARELPTVSDPGPAGLRTLLNDGIEQHELHQYLDHAGA